MSFTFKHMQADLERLRQVVEKPVPVRVILAEGRYRALERECGFASGTLDAGGLLRSSTALWGVRVDYVTGGDPTYGEVVYSDGSRRPI